MWNCNEVLEVETLLGPLLSDHDVHDARRNFPLSAHHINHTQSELFSLEMHTE